MIIIRLEFWVVDTRQSEEGGRRKEKNTPLEQRRKEPQLIKTMVKGIIL